MKITRPARVIPWDAMTPEQQAEHLVLMHGWLNAGTSSWIHTEDHVRRARMNIYHTHDKEA